MSQPTHAKDYWSGMGGHLWWASKGEGSTCARPGCGLNYREWSGDRCGQAPDCENVNDEGVRCMRELGHDDEHRAQRWWEWS